MKKMLQNLQSIFFTWTPQWKLRNNILNYVRELWSGTRAPERELDLVAIFHDFKSGEKKSHTVDDGTWSDLGMDEILEKVDRTVSAVGHQFLYHMMKTYANDSDTSSDNNHLYTLFKENPELRERIQVLLYRLKDRNASYIPHLFFESLPRKPKYFFLFRLSSIACFTSTLMVYFIPAFSILFFGTGIANLIIHHWYSRRIYEHFSSLSHLNTLLKVGHQLSTIDHGGQIKQLDFLNQNREFVKSVSKRIGWLVIDKASLPELGMYIIEYFNQFCLFDILVFHRSMDLLATVHDKMLPIYEAVASLDACISVASFINENPYTVPVFNDTGKMHFENLYHPLLKDPVPNSVTLNNRSVLITGSNMAGKTTFIRAIGINVILAQTLSICLAEYAEFQRLNVKSFIKREDDLKGGKSYYFTEVEKLLEFTQLQESCDPDTRYLFLLDEIFKGTNTVERISISTAVLEFLGKKSIAMVTTHDIELAEFLHETFEIYHFSEVIVNGHYGFDYLLKKGPCQTRNAIKLLELTGYPKDITEMAHYIGKQISR
jgi:MutS domain V